MILLLFLGYREYLPNALEKLLGRKGKGQTFAVKLKVQNETISVCLEQGNMAVSNFANLFVIPNVQYTVVYLDQLAHCVYSIRNTCVTLCN